jgi:hypothetical protein
MVVFGWGISLSEVLIHHAFPANIKPSTRIIKTSLSEHYIAVQNSHVEDNVIAKRGTQGGGTI